MIFPHKEYCKGCWRCKIGCGSDTFRNPSVKYCIQCENDTRDFEQLNVLNIISGWKYCRACMEHHPLDHFIEDDRSKDGYQHECIQFRNTR